MPVARKILNDHRAPRNFIFFLLLFMVVFFIFTSRIASKHRFFFASIRGNARDAFDLLVSTSLANL